MKRELEALRIREISKQYLFPYHLFREGCNVLIYGDKVIGEKFAEQALDYCKIIGVAEFGQNDSMLIEEEYDYILLATQSVDEAHKLKEVLLKHGVQEPKIKWDGKSYDRDGFYQNVYFPILREIL